MVSCALSCIMGLNSSGRYQERRGFKRLMKWRGYVSVKYAETFSQQLTLCLDCLASPLGKIVLLIVQWQRLLVPFSLAKWQSTAVQANFRRPSVTAKDVSAVSK